MLLHAFLRIVQLIYTVYKRNIQTYYNNFIIIMMMYIIEKYPIRICVLCAFKRDPRGSYISL